MSVDNIRIMGTHQPIPHIPEKTLARLVTQLLKELPAAKVAHLFDIPESEVKQQLPVPASAAVPTLSQSGLYRPLREQLLTDNQQSVLPACQLAAGQELTQMLQQGLEIMASPTCR